MPGGHNVANALAACGACIELDIPFVTIKKALKKFSGVHRRLEVKWNGDIRLLDDYGHHPTEIRATLAAVRKLTKGRIVVVFQPHRYTRTKALMDEFIPSFNEADALFITEIYAASEDRIEGVTGEILADRVRAGGHKQVLFVPTKEEAAEKVLQITKKGDIVITLGAGDIYKIDERLRSVWSGKA